MWLPECGYRPGGRTSEEIGSKLRRGIESFLAERNLKISFSMDTTFCKRKSPRPTGLPWAERRLPVRVWCLLISIKEDYPGEAPAAASGLRQEGQVDLYAVHKTGRPESGESAFFPAIRTQACRYGAGNGATPGDPSYLEFHKKHSPGGLRYWRVTDHESDLGTKKIYDPEQARARAMAHAAHFKGLIKRGARAISRGKPAG